MEKLNPNALNIIYTEQLYDIDTKQKTQAVVQEATSTSESVAQESTPVEAPEIKVLGNNTTGTLVLSNESGAPFLTNSDYSFLEKIIGATGQKLEDCAIVNCYRKIHSIQEIVDFTGCKNVLTFGINVFEIGIKNKAPLNYECQEQLGGTIQLIPSDGLNIVAGNSEKKKALWLSLKRMYNI